MAKKKIFDYLFFKVLNFIFYRFALENLK